MVNTKIRLIIFFAAKGGDALYNQQKQDRELTVAQIMNSLLPNSDLNWRKWGKPLDHSVWPKSNPYTVEVRNRFKGLDLIEFCQENALVIANTLFPQHKRRLYTWTSPGGQYQNQTDYILCSQRWRSSIQSAKTRPGADCVPNSGLNWRK